MIKIGIDLMGGDHAPLAILEGVDLFCQDISDPVHLVLIGDVNLTKKLFPNQFDKLSSYSGITFINATQAIEMGESPTKSFSTKRDSSIVVGYKMLVDRQLDSFASAGNTGAMMVGAYSMAKPIEGVIRPCISAIIPKGTGKCGLLLDVGVNPDCKAENLLQFGLLGSAYLKMVYNISNPRVALLNLGSEPEKGNLLTQAAYPLMAASENINFSGNLEGYDIFLDKYDVIVCDGFTGNVILKSIEGIFNHLIEENINNPFINSLNYENYGGTPILGISYPVIVGHGVSSPKAIKNMIKLSHSVIEKNLIEELKNVFQSIKKI